MRRHRRQHVTVGLAALVAGVVGLGGCGAEARLDGARVEAEVAAHLSEAFDVDVTEVICPEDIPAEAGRITTCRARVEAGTLPVRVRQRDGEGDLVVEPSAAVLVRARVEADVSHELEETSSRSDVVVTCDGAAQQIVAVDETIRCTAVDGEDDIDVTVRVRDAAGAVAYEVAD